MSMIDSIASLSTALSLARVQTAVATKVLKISQDQGQVAADLVSAAAEDLKAMVEDFAGDLGTRFDAYG